MKNISGENVTKAKKVIMTQGSKVEFDKNVDMKALKGVASHGSHRSHSSS